MKKIATIIALISHLSSFSMENITAEDSTGGIIERIQKELPQHITNKSLELNEKHALEFIAPLIAKHFETLVATDEAISEEDYLSNVRMVWEKEGEQCITNMKEALLQVDLNDLLFGEFLPYMDQKVVNLMKNKCIESIINSDDAQKKSFLTQAKIFKKVYQLHQANKKQ